MSKQEADYHIERIKKRESNQKMYNDFVSQEKADQDLKNELMRQ